MYKLYAIVLGPSIKAMKGNRGRMIVQAAHGFVHALWDAEKRFPDAYKAYRQQTAFKIALVAETAEYIRELHQSYQPVCGVSLVEETGSTLSGEIKTEYAMLTCLGLGPIHVDDIKGDLLSLKSFL